MLDMYNILFRVDGSPNIGMGHIMRSLTIAKEFKRRNCNVIFLSKYKEGIEKIVDEGFEAIKLESSKNMNSHGYDYGDEGELIDEINDIRRRLSLFHQIDLLLVDSYNVTDDYFLEMKKYVNRLAYIDDLNKHCKYIDILINGNITASDVGYKKFRPDQLLFLGTKYNLIRDEFKNLPKRQINTEVKKVMITTGGADPYNMSAKLLNIFLQNREYKDLEYHVVVGQGFRNIDELKMIGKRFPNVILREKVRKMSEIMLECDIAVSSGGGTLYELCSCGTPTIAFVVAENQEKLVNKLNELKYIRTIGWYDTITEDRLISIFNELYIDKNKREKIYLKGRTLVDGLGGKRIVNKIINLLDF